jgi:hypothetical protein
MAKAFVTSSRKRTESLQKRDLPASTLSITVSHLPRPAPEEECGAVIKQRSFGTASGEVRMKRSADRWSELNALLASSMPSLIM